MKYEWVARIYEKVSGEKRLMTTIYSELKDVVVNSITHYINDYIHDGETTVELTYEMTEDVAGD